MQFTFNVKAVFEFKSHSLSGLKAFLTRLFASSMWLFLRLCPVLESGTFLSSSLVSSPLLLVPALNGLRFPGEGLRSLSALTFFCVVGCSTETCSRAEASGVTFPNIFW